MKSDDVTNFDLSNSSTAKVIRKVITSSILIGDRFVGFGNRRSVQVISVV